MIVNAVAPEFLKELKNKILDFDENQTIWKPNFYTYRNNQGNEVAVWEVITDQEENHGIVCRTGICNTVSDYLQWNDTYKMATEYIAAVCPENVKTMINEIERLRRTNSLLEDTILLLKERERVRKN